MKESAEKAYKNIIITIIWNISKWMYVWKNYKVRRASWWPRPIGYQYREVFATGLAHLGSKLLLTKILKRMRLCQQSIIQISCYQEDQANHNLTLRLLVQVSISSNQQTYSSKVSQRSVMVQQRAIHLIGALVLVISRTIIVISALDSHQLLILFSRKTKTCNFWSKWIDQRTKDSFNKA